MVTSNIAPILWSSLMSIGLFSVGCWKIAVLLSLADAEYEGG